MTSRAEVRLRFDAGDFARYRDRDAIAVACLRRAYLALSADEILEVRLRVEEVTFIQWCETSGAGRPEGDMLQWQTFTKPDAESLRGARLQASRA